MIIYLLKSAGCLSLLLFFYHFILEKEKMHNFNRFYLLGGVLFSFLAPLATITISSSDEAIEVVQNLNQPVFTDEILPLIVEESFNYTQLFIGIYIFISCVFLIRFVINLSKIFRKINQNKSVNYKNAILILVDDKILPHTFWKYIFLNKSDYQNDKIEKELFTHELTHVTQKHTIDVILIELLQVVFWINPLFIFLKKAIQLNHEFLADQTVIHQHKNTFQYQYLLLNKAAWNNEYYLASNLNYSLTKKRLEMMTTQSSKTKILLKKLAVIPLLVGFIFLFAERVEAQEKLETIYEQSENIQKKSNKNNSELYKEFVYSNGYIQTKDKSGKKINKKYSELTDKEKKSIPPPPPLKSKKKIPTQKLIEDLKDKSKYALWIDGKVVKNSVLNDYKNSDFSNHFVSFVHKNARSKKYPQENQVHLETHQYFKKQNLNRVKAFEKFKNNNIQTIKEVSYTNQGESVETGFKIIKGNRYYFVSVGNKTKYYNKDGKLVNSSGKILSSKKAKASSIIPENYVTKTYFKGEVFCDFIDDKPISKNEVKDKEFRKIIKKIENKYGITKYNKLNKLYEEVRTQKPHYINSSKKRKEDIEEQFSLLGTLYFKLSKNDKKKVKRPILPHDPYLKLRKNNKVFYKLRNELTEDDKLLIPPPPPPPNATKEEILRAKKAYKEWKKRTENDIPPPPPPRHHLDQVIKMAKKGAKFYYEGEPIHSDKAIELLKKNKKLNIHSESTNYSNYKVWISKKPIKN